MNEFTFPPYGTNTTGTSYSLSCNSLLESNGFNDEGDDEEGGAGVREPRRPRYPAPTSAAELPIPDEPSMYELVTV